MDETRGKQYGAQSCAVDIQINERSRQLEKWEPQDSDTWLERLSILMEEIGKLAKAINRTWFPNVTPPGRSGLEKIRKEAVQVATATVSIIEATLRLGADPLAR